MTDSFRTIDGFGTLDEFLDEIGTREEATAAAIKRVIAIKLGEAMRERKLTKVAMAKLMNTSRKQLDRVLDPDEQGVTLETLTRAAKTVGRKLRVDLV